MIETSSSPYKNHYPAIATATDGTIHVALSSQNEATFLCKNCGNAVTREISKFIHAPTAIRVKCKCKCGHLFWALVDRRRNYRKISKLLGICLYVMSSGHIKRRVITTLDISSSGLQFSIYGQPEFKLRDKIIYQVRLDDSAHTEIKGRGLVKRIRSNRVGMEFITIDRPGKLSFYLMH